MRMRLLQKRLVEARIASSLRPPIANAVSCAERATVWRRTLIHRGDIRVGPNLGHGHCEIRHAWCPDSDG